MMANPEHTEDVDATSIDDPKAAPTATGHDGAITSSPQVLKKRPGRPRKDQVEPPMSLEETLLRKSWGLNTPAWKAQSNS